jgi:CubicO group peptidase (beta-lactamase class C family)
LIRKSLFTTICISATFLFAHAQSKTGKDFIPAFARFVQDEASAERFSGSVLIAKSGKVIFEHAYGLADRKANRAVTPETQFDLGSMPKMFTAVAIAQLAEAGKLSYEDTVGKHLPEYPNETVRNQVTIHQLLTHTAGLGNYFRPGFLEKRLKSIPEYLAFIADEPLVAKPGERWEYSNSGYVVLGAIIEKVSGQDFYSYIQEHIFKPAGMQRTGYYTTDKLPESVAMGYTSGGMMMVRPNQPDSGKPVPGAGTQRHGADRAAPPTDAHAGMKIIHPPQDGKSPDGVGGAQERRENVDFRPYRGSPAGGAYSTVEDLLRFSEALMKGNLVSPSSLQELTEGKMATRPNGPKYGYGFLEWRVNGIRIIGHGGGGPGVNSMLQIYPELGYTVIVLSNFDPPAAENIAAKAREQLTSLQHG